MARAKSSGAGIYVGLVLLGIGFMTCLIISIMLYTRVAKSDDAARQASTSLRRFVSQAEEGGADIAAMLGDTDAGTVVGQLRDENMALKRMIDDRADAAMKQIKARVDANVTEDVSLLREIARLKAEFESNTARIAELEKALTDAQARVAAAEKGNRELTAEYERAKDELESQVAAMTASQQTYQGNVDEQRTTLQAQLTSARTDLNRQLTSIRNELSAAMQENQQLRDRIRVLTTERESTALGRVDASTLPDGEVMAVMMDEDLVYIDRGSNHRVLLGLTFQVFDRIPGMVTDQNGEYTGKAKIEVVQVGENSSVARVVERERDANVNVGDIIANVVYDPNMTFKFYVYGEFDIDGVGQATVSDRRRLETMIQQWGGKVMPRRPSGTEYTLSYEVDFLVLGVEPALPDEPDASQTDPLVLNAYRASLEQYETYQKLIAEAATLSIPVLNQNRFLTMVGYYQR